MTNRIGKGKKYINIFVDFHFIRTPVSLSVPVTQSVPLFPHSIQRSVFPPPASPACLDREVTTGEDGTDFSPLALDPLMMAYQKK